MKILTIILDWMHAIVLSFIPGSTKRLENELEDLKKQIKKKEFNFKCEVDHTENFKDLWDIYKKKFDSATSVEQIELLKDKFDKSKEKLKNYYEKKKEEA